MKILITTDWYKPAVNGVVTSVTNLADGLTELGNEVRILTLAGGIHTLREENVIRLGSMEAGRIYPNARVRTAPSRRVINELIAWQPDIVHSQCEFCTFPLARRIARCSRIPLVHTYHTVYEDYTSYFSPYVKLGKKVAAEFSKLIISETNAVIAPTEKIARLLERYEVEKPMFVIPSGLALESFSLPDAEKANRRAAVRFSYGIGADEPVLLYVGRLAKEKNITELFDLLKGSASSEWRLLLAGDGPYRAELEEYAEKAGVSSRVVFAGMIPPERITDYYAAGDVFVSASQSETQGLTYIEAMASSLPVLCKYDPCLDGVIEQGINGCTYRAPDQFREHSDRLLASEQFRRELGEAAARTTRAKYSTKRFAGSVYGVYEQSIANHIHSRCFRRAAVNVFDRI